MIVEFLIVALLIVQVGLLFQICNRIGLVASNQRRAHEQAHMDMEQTAATLVSADSRTAATLADADSRRQTTTGATESVNTRPFEDWS